MNTSITTLRHAVLLFTVLVCSRVAVAQNDFALKQVPKLRELPDFTAELQQQIEHNHGNLELAEHKFYRITAPLEFDLARYGAVKITARRGATLIMDGPGPALRFTGSHQGTAAPRTFVPATWNERMPLISGLEILGSHPQADGIELIRTVAAGIRDVSVRWCRHGIHLTDRNRNVIVSGCHLYENSGVGLYLDDVNLHQINVSTCHISYNRQGGIVVRDGNVRNLQVSGCDLEANMPADGTPTKTANILLDVSATEPDTSHSIAEVSITGCTIQHAANYGHSKTKHVAPGGANIRLNGKKSWPIDSVTITGNVLSDTTVNIDLRHATDVAIAANNFFAPAQDNLKVADCQRIVVTGNTFNPRQFIRPGTIQFVNSSDCMVSGCTVHQFATAKGAIILQGCQNFTLNAVTLSDCGSGIVVRQSTGITLLGCRVRNAPDAGPDLLADSDCRELIVHACAFSGTVERPTEQDD